MKIRQIVFPLIIACVLISCNRQSPKSNDLIVQAPSQDPELEKAKQDALLNFDSFIKSYNTHSNDLNYYYYLKTDFIDDGEHEHMWILVNKIENERFEGTLDNEPITVKNVKFGDLIKITKDQIEDWIIVDTETDKQEGGYSVKVLNNRMH